MIFIPFAKLEYSFYSYYNIYSFFSYICFERNFSFVYLLDFKKKKESWKQKN